MTKECSKGGDHVDDPRFDEAVYSVRVKCNDVYGISLDMCEVCASAVIKRLAHHADKRVNLTLLEDW